MRQKSYVIGIIVFLLQSPLWALHLHASPQGSLCDQAARLVAPDSGVPLPILLSIARVETGRRIDGHLIPWPWSLNVSGESHFFASKDDALSFAENEIAQGNINFDVGCFQVNLKWHSGGFSSLSDSLDPVSNARYAAGFLTTLYSETNSWKSAVASYHSRSPKLGEKYVTKVSDAWQSVKASTDLANASESLKIAAVPAYPLLQGGAGQNGSLVPVRSTTPQPLLGR